MLTVALVVVGGCSDDDARGDGGSPPADSSSGEGGGGNLRSCPSRGIGVADDGGYSRIEQLTNWRRFDCRTPQICPGRNEIALDAVKLDANGKVDVSLALTNCSVGKQALAITQVIVYGDSRCHFSEATYSKDSVAPGAQTAVHLTLTPKAVGEDQASIVIYSNARNFPGLRVPLCARVSSDGTSSGSFSCKRVTSLTPACHKE